MDWFKAAVVCGAVALAGCGQASGGGPVISGTALSISATGEATGKPDMATITVGVTVQATSAAAAMNANSQRMNALMNTLHTAGIADADIQTTNVSISPEGYPRITRYQADNSVRVKVRALEKLGPVIDAVVDAGGNTISGVMFGYADDTAHLDAARRDAVTEARRRADLYAQALGLHVARVVSVVDGEAPSYPMPMNLEFDMAAQARRVANAPIAPGEIETRVPVNVTFELR